MLGFQRGFDFTSVDLWSPAADSSGEKLHRCKRKLHNLAVLLASGQHFLFLQGPWGLIKTTGLLVSSTRNPPALHRYTDCSLQARFCQHKWPNTSFSPSQASAYDTYLLPPQATFMHQQLHGNPLAIPLGMQLTSPGIHEFGLKKDKSVYLTASKSWVPSSGNNNHLAAHGTTPATRLRL